MATRKSTNPSEKSTNPGKSVGGFGYDPQEAVRHLSAADPTLARLIKLAGAFNLQLRRLHNPFEALARNIVYQQLHGNAAAAIHTRLLAVFGKPRLDPQDLLSATDAELRGAGLSQAKLLALRDLAARTVEGSLPTLAQLRWMKDEAIVERLTEVRGIGRWTVEMLLIFRLGRPDVLPVGDYAVRKGFMLTYGWKDLPKPKELTEYGERWRPYRSVASWYLWRAVELPGDALAQISA